MTGADASFTTAAFVDSDGDGLPDDYETAHGLDPHNAADALADADGDGQTNLAEYLAGTDPANPADALHVLAVSAGGTGVTVQFTTVFGKRYVVERTASLTSPAWSAVSATLNGNGTPLSSPTPPRRPVAGRPSTGRGWSPERASPVAERCHAPGKMTKLSSSGALPWTIAHRRSREMPLSLLSTAGAVARVSRASGLAVLLAVGVGMLPFHGRAQSPPVVADAAGYHLEATWKVGGEGGWDYLTFDPQSRRLYVTRTDRVQVIDGDKGMLLGEVHGLEGGHGVALAPELNRGFASSGKSGSVIMFDLQTLAPVGGPIPVGRKPDAIIYDPATKHVFAFNGDSKDASVIDAATAKVVATIPLGGGPEFAAVDGQGGLFVNLEDEGLTLAIDTQKNAVAQRWPLAPGEGPSGLAMDPARHRLFAGCHNAQMAVLDAASGKVLATPPIGKGVDACAFDPGTGLAFASCGDGTLTVVREDPAKPGAFIAEKINTQRGARTMALDPKTHAVYLAAADFEAAPTPAAGERPARPKIVPGSFVVLKFVR